MKRPEGFDRAKREQPPAARSAKSTSPAKSARPAPGAKPVVSRAPKPAPAAKPATAALRPKTTTARPPTRSGEASRQLRKAAAARRRYERAEVRRFTRRSRRRRVTWAVVIGVFLVLGAFVVGAVYSPFLALRTITITGTSRVDKGELLKALDGQLGTPLALVDFGTIRTELARYPLIRSYVTESVPPDTLIIRVSERAPIAVLQTASGFSVIDPAGVVLESPTTRPAGLPVLTGSAALTGGGPFQSAAQVLLALPPALLATVDTVSAQTKDDVGFTLTTGQKVIWGSAEDSDLKARVLAALVKTQSPNAHVSYNVSAPNNPVIGAG